MTERLVQPVPAVSDAARLQRLAACGVNNSAREPLFDQLVADAARLTAVPVAILGFLDADREWIKAAVGWNVMSLPTAYSLAARLVHEQVPTVVSDMTADPRFAVHPLVSGTPFLRFLASVPLIDDDGIFLGALTILDRAPRSLKSEQSDILGNLAGRVMAELRIRRQAAEIERFASAAADAEERFREFFERTTDLIMSIDADGRLLHANQALFDALAMRREDVVNQPLSRVVESSVRDDFRIAFSEVIAAGEPKSIETVFVSSTGKRINVEGGVHPKVIDGRSVLARVMFRDITERINFESELGRAKDAALEAARLKTQFLTNVSHEIRTPMNGIVGMIDLLTSTALNEEQRDFAMQARASAEQLLTIVNNILYVSNLEAGGLAASNVDFDLFRMLQRIAEVMKVGVLGKDVDVTLDWDQRLPAVFRGNQAKLRQVVTNLMENAVKFTEQGRVTLSVHLQTETNTHRVVRFEVRDTGIGISDEDRLLLFEKFSQIEAGSTRRFGGVGLGLSTARHLVETMGGLMDVESTPGVGTCFWFVVSFAKEMAVKPIASSDLSFNGKRVLVVDAALTHRKVVRHYLETIWEMRADAAETAAEALAMLRRAAAAGDPYRVVLYDRAADLDEITFAREVHADKSISATRLILMTSDNTPVNEERLREASVQAYVAKPVGQSELFDALTIALAKDALPLSRPLSGRWRAVALPPPPVPPEKKRSVRVLLVEDNFLNMKLTMSQLTKLGYQADSVANGKEALDAVAGGDYDIIVMDCQMPIMDGYDATTEIRKRDAATGRKRRIVAMTANALEGDREKCLAAGMDDYLSKPTKQNELEVALARYFVV
jgi:two-component system sensor histidine kinase/response regulator